MSGDGTVPFPNGSHGQLPPMSPQERRVWAASHNLPENMLLVATDEMYAMNDAFQAACREVEMWRKIGRIYMGADLPESFEPALRLYMKSKEHADERVRELEAKAPAAKVKAAPGVIPEP